MYLQPIGAVTSNKLSDDAYGLASRMTTAVDAVIQAMA